MGANAQTSVPTFTAGDVLTAANMNISARTGVPVFSNTTTRDAGFGGTGEKTLAEGQLCYLEDSNVVQYYDGAAWATVGPASAGALTLISSTTIGSAVSSVTVSSAFSSTYDNYKIMIIGGTSSVLTGGKLTLGATTTGYYNGAAGATYAGVSSVFGAANQGWWDAVLLNTNGFASEITLWGPNLAQITMVTADVIRPTTTGQYERMGGYLNNTTQYTAFTIATTSGTMTGGTIRVYGMANS